MTDIKTIHQGDINFVPMKAFRSNRGANISINREKPLRQHSKRLLIQEGEITGHHHGVWFMPQPTKFREDGAGSGGAAVADEMLKKTLAAKVTATLYRDDKLTMRLTNRGLLRSGAPVIGYLVCDADVTIKHASEDGKPTGEHAPVKLSKGEYLVLGKRELDMYEKVQRRVVD